MPSEDMREVTVTYVGDGDGVTAVGYVFPAGVPVVVPASVASVLNKTTFKHKPVRVSRQDVPKIEGGK